MSQTGVLPEVNEQDLHVFRKGETPFHLRDHGSRTDLGHFKAEPAIREQAGPTRFSELPRRIGRHITLSL